MTLRILRFGGRPWVVASLVAALATVTSLAGQEPIPADTIPAQPDTAVVPVPVRGDTIPAVEAEPDTLRPAPRLPELPGEEAAGWSAQSIVHSAGRRADGRFSDAVPEPAIPLG
jgi:hypothetical protein